jgi:hypothetical protein
MVSSVCLGGAPQPADLSFSERPRKNRNVVDCPSKVFQAHARFPTKRQRRGTPYTERRYAPRWGSCETAINPETHPLAGRRKHDKTELSALDAPRDSDRMGSRALLVDD